MDELIISDYSQEDISDTKYYVEIDNKGLPKAFYVSDIVNEIPDTAIEITKEQWEEWSSHPNKYAYVDGQLIDISQYKWDGTQWVPLTQDDILNNLKEEKIQELGNYITSKIYELYPDLTSDNVALAAPTGKARNQPGHDR